MLSSGSGTLYGQVACVGMICKWVKYQNNSLYKNMAMTTATIIGNDNNNKDKASYKSDKDNKFKPFVRAYLGSFSGHFSVQK